MEIQKFEVKIGAHSEPQMTQQCISHRSLYESGIHPIHEFVIN